MEKQKTEGEENCIPGMRFQSMERSTGSVNDHPQSSAEELQELL